MWPNRYTYRGLLSLGAVALVFYLALLAGTRARTLVMAKITNQVLLKVREDLYSHIQTLSFHFLTAGLRGKILARVIGDVNSLKEMLTDSVTQLVPEFITVVGVAVIMAVKNPILAPVGPDHRAHSHRRFVFYPGDRP